MNPKQGERLSVCLSHKQDQSLSSPKDQSFLTQPGVP